MFFVKRGQPDSLSTKLRQRCIDLCTLEEDLPEKYKGKDHQLSILACNMETYLLDLSRKSDLRGLDVEALDTEALDTFISAMIDGMEQTWAKRL